MFNKKTSIWSNFCIGFTIVKHIGFFQDNKLLKRLLFYFVYSYFYCFGEVVTLQRQFVLSGWRCGLNVVDIQGEKSGELFNCP